MFVRPEFFYKLIYGYNFSDLGGGGGGGRINISRKNSKTSKVNKPTVCIKTLNNSSFSKKSGQDNLI